jgi:hypothetical protein
MTSTRKLSYDDYTVAWICALPVEMAAARMMLDEVLPTGHLLEAPIGKFGKLYLGRISLNQYLHKIGIAESQDYTCREGVQSLRYILLECRMLVSVHNKM